MPGKKWFSDDNIAKILELNPDIVNVEDSSEKPSMLNAYLQSLMEVNNANKTNANIVDSTLLSDVINKKENAFDDLKVWYGLMEVLNEQAVNICELNGVSTDADKPRAKDDDDSELSAQKHAEQDYILHMMGRFANQIATGDMTKIVAFCNEEIGKIEKGIEADERLLTPEYLESKKEDKDFDVEKHTNEHEDKITNAKAELECWKACKHAANIAYLAKIRFTKEFDVIVMNSTVFAGGKVSGDKLSILRAYFNNLQQLQDDPKEMSINLKSLHPMIDEKAQNYDELRIWYHAMLEFREAAVKIQEIATSNTNTQGYEAVFPQLKQVIQSSDMKEIEAFCRKKITQFTSGDIIAHLQQCVDAASHAQKETNKYLKEMQGSLQGVIDREKQSCVSQGGIWKSKSSTPKMPRYHELLDVLEKIVKNASTVGELKEAYRDDAVKTLQRATINSLQEKNPKNPVFEQYKAIEKFAELDSVIKALFKESREILSPPAPVVVQAANMSHGKVSQILNNFIINGENNAINKSIRKI